PQGREPTCGGVGTLIVKAHAVAQTPHVQLAPCARLLIPGLWARRQGADFNVAKAGRHEAFDGLRVFVEPRGYAKRRGKTEAERGYCDAGVRRGHEPEPPRHHEEGPSKAKRGDGEVV